MSSWEGSACYPRSTFYPLSDGPSMRNRRITMLQFPACAACRPPSQAPFCHYTLRPVTNRPEGTLREPPLRFWRRPPQSNYPPNAVLGFTKLVPRRPKGRISTTAPRTLACPLRRLRPILHIDSPGTTLSYSKGSRGLFVPSRVIGIFTDTTISLGSRLRQCPDHYTIRAGRNLPDKEFRYLRTVIVTAAVYRGFNSSLLIADELSS